MALQHEPWCYQGSSQHNATNQGMQNELYTPCRLLPLQITGGEQRSRWDGGQDVTGQFRARDTKEDDGHKKPQHQELFQPVWIGGNVIIGIAMVAAAHNF